MMSYDKLVVGNRFVVRYRFACVHRCMGALRGARAHIAHRDNGCLGRHMVEKRPQQRRAPFSLSLTSTDYLDGRRRRLLLLLYAGAI